MKPLAMLLFPDPHRRVSFGSSPATSGKLPCFISPVVRTHYPSAILLETPEASLPKRRSTAPSMTSCTCFTVEAARSDRPAQCPSRSQQSSERDSQFFSVITAELEPVRAPSLISFTATLPVCACSDGGTAVFAQATAHSGA